MDLRNNKQTTSTERERDREQHSDPFIREADPAGTKKLFIKWTLEAQSEIRHSPRQQGYYTPNNSVQSRDPQ